MREEEGKLATELRREGKLTTDADVDRAMRLAFRYGRATRAWRCPTVGGILILIILIGIPLLFAVVIMNGG